jgi:pilus assembly protein Flp/PilA
MKELLLRSLANLHKEESGQDLIEYALVVALIALAATAGMSVLANAINVAFSKLGSILNAYIG